MKTMSDFKEFRALLQDHFNEMVKGENPLFITDADEDELYNLYLDSFPAGTNELFRKRRKYDCSCCRRFVKNIGNRANNLYPQEWRIRSGYLPEELSFVC